MSCSKRILRTTSALAVIALAGLTAACTTETPGAPVEYREGHFSEHPLPAGNTYTVQRGDTIYGVARQFNLSVRSLIDANNLQPPYQLTVGQVLGLSTNSDYQVAKGDTLLGISRRIGVPFATLARMNNLQPPYVVKLGQRLKLPAGSEPTTAVASAAPPPPVDMPKIAQAVLPTPVAAAPAPAPGKKDGYTTLAEREKSAAAQPPTPVSAPAPAVVAPAPVVEPRLASAAAPPPPMPAVPPKSGRGFLWPVKGEVIGEFGAAGRGVHNDGINIAVPRGTPVHASDDGVVAYSGNELRGFGNLLLIKHADGWMTAYAHNDQLLVKRGDTVKRGQKIALAGDSGGVSQPQVHFEVRQGTRAVDPMTFLKDKASAASGRADPPDPG